MIPYRIAPSIVASMLMLGACASYKTNIVSPRLPQDFLRLDDKECNNEHASKICADIKDISIKEKACYQKPDVNCRNEVMGRTRSWIDYFWLQFRSAYFGRLGGIQAAVDGTTTALSAAAAVTTPPGAAQVVSAASASISGIGSAVQKNFAGDTASYVILAQMDADRQRVGASIAEKMIQEIDKYSLAQGMADLAEYAGTMSVPSALASLAAKAGETKVHANEKQFPLK